MTIESTCNLLQLRDYQHKSQIDLLHDLIISTVGNPPFFRQRGLSPYPETLKRGRYLGEDTGGHGWTWAAN